MREKSATVLHTYIALLVVIIFISCVVLSVLNEHYFMALVFLCIGIIFSTGISVVHPNEAIVILFMGRYVGSVREVGLFMTVPFSRTIKVSLKVQTAESIGMEIKDQQKIIMTNPIIVYRVVDSAKAVFDVDDYLRFINVQIELVINTLLDEEGFDNEKIDRENIKLDIQKYLTTCIQKRLEIAGIEVIEVKLLSNS